MKHVERAHVQAFNVGVLCGFHVVFEVLTDTNSESSNTYKMLNCLQLDDQVEIKDCRRK